MTLFVFAGPTISSEEARGELDAVYLPPVAQGDVYRVALKRPTAIGIIDGYFDRVPAVWHKEILWAMAQGIHVFGSASLGALRAAELVDFGMEGVGQIFAAYRDGILDGDDEVALAHATAEFGYRPLSEPLVNIRATLRKAVECGVITAPTQAVMEDAAKGLFYPNRTFAQILDAAQRSGVSAAEYEALSAWLPTGRLNLKKDDALLMLRTMRERFTGGCAAKKVDFHFERTALWDDLTRSAGDLKVGEDSVGETVLLDALVTELQLEREGYGRAMDGATTRLLALEEARRHHLEVDEDTLYRAVIEFRRQQQLLEPADLAQWMKDNDLAREDFVRLMGDLVAQRWTAALIKPDVWASLPDFLRLTGRYVQLQQRARAKQSWLATSGLLDAEQDAAQVEQILKWYFLDRLRMESLPELPAYAEQMGFADVPALRRAIVGEFLYCTAGPGNSGS